MFEKIIPNSSISICIFYILIRPQSIWFRINGYKVGNGTPVRRLCQPTLSNIKKSRQVSSFKIRYIYYLGDV